jgi:arylsulfatase A-like enzyme
MTRFLCTLLTVVTTLSATPPNILVIYSDDHGWADLGAQGIDADIRTPNLDQLAADGVRCTHGYVSAPQCVPSRAGLLTGRYQQRFGLEDNQKGALPLSEITIAEHLKTVGYVTGQVGKWHLDLRATDNASTKKDRSPLVAHMPMGQGFDESFRGEMSKFYATHDLAGLALKDPPQVVNDNRFRVEVQTDGALAFLKRREAAPAQPWMLYLAYYTPHVPMESPEPWFSKTPAHLPLERRQALAMIAAMDEGIGKIRDRLKAMNQYPNTLIFFIGDNGAPVKPGNWDGSINAPLIGEKGMLTDGGVRVPFLVSWPEKLPAGKVYDKPVFNLDVTATACAAAGVKLPADAPRLDGVDLLPYLTGEISAAPHQTLFWRWRSQAAALEHPWKLVLLSTKEKMLFDISKPEGEKHNLIASQPTIAEGLERKLTTWSQDLQPPGLPEEVNEQDAIFFSTHVSPEFSRYITKREPKKDTAMLGWQGRNGSLARADGVLRVQALKGAKQPTFITISPIDFLGAAVLEIKAGKVAVVGPGSVSYRIRHESDFDPAKRVPFEWTATGATARIGAKSRITHLRIYLPEHTPEAEITSISLRREGQPPLVWDFTVP